MYSIETGGLFFDFASYGTTGEEILDIVKGRQGDVRRSFLGEEGLVRGEDDVVEREEAS